MFQLTDEFNIKDIYELQMSFHSPFFFNIDFATWKRSFETDVDGEGRTLFKELNVKAVYDHNQLLGFIQFGKTAFGFDGNGDISGSVSYPVIRNLYFKDNMYEVGKLLLNEVMVELGSTGRVYAFFHYFGMSCFARHGKLFENNTHIASLLKDNGFVVEHENVYYSSVLRGCENSDVLVSASDLTKGRQQYLNFILDDKQVGGCEVHFVSKNIAYLRWIYINGDLVGKGIGTKCMNALKAYLFNKGINRFDTDTALDNTVAQHYYDKNNFNCEGITRSYYKV